MTDYFDDMMKNHRLCSDSIASEDNIQMGGGKNQPFGGFPPIYICDKSNEKENENIKQKKEYVKPQKAVSISDIMKKRKDVDVFANI